MFVTKTLQRDFRSHFCGAPRVLATIQDALPRGQLGTSCGKQYSGSQSLHQPSIRPYYATMILLCEHPADVGRYESGKHLFVFQGAWLAPNERQEPVTSD